MIDFFSGNTRMVDSSQAVDKCFELAFGENSDYDCDFVIVYFSMGHRFEDIIKRVKELAPSAKILGASCCGVIGTEGVGESMKEIAMMALRCSDGELLLESVDDICGQNSFEKARSLATALSEKSNSINMLYYISSGIDVANDQAIAGIESVFGGDIPIFGATSSDNMRGLTNHQIADGKVMSNGAFLLGFADPTLEVITHATHGFVAEGEPFTVTRSEGNCIYELDGEVAWTAYTSRLGLSDSAMCVDTIPSGALAEKLPDEQLSDSSNDYALRAVTKRGENGEMFYANNCPVGTKLWLTCRDEELIFSEVDKMMKKIVSFDGYQPPVAVFHADCLARGRLMFGQVRKEEITAALQKPLSSNGVTPPWLGVYGFGEFARLGEKNYFHNYSTALAVIYRKSEDCCG